uniref:Uncharacterized protein n=1 Tax=Rousettus aegyptiacus TaxID=9407 RepID=A0A7J8GA62_ROUAE|nr:hypothetical protein HJG63_011616 [Rousettus aegyptiacus]
MEDGSQGTLALQREKKTAPQLATIYVEATFSARSQSGKEKGNENDSTENWKTGSHSGPSSPLPSAELTHEVRECGKTHEEGSCGLIVVSPRTLIPRVTVVRKLSAKQRTTPGCAEPTGTPPPVPEDADLSPRPQRARGKESGSSTRTLVESRIIRQKGKTNDKDKKCKEWNRGKKLTNVGQDKDNSIKGVDKKQTLGTVREWRRRRLWFQRVMPRSGCPLDAPDPHRRRQCLPAGISKETVTVTHMERQYRFDSGDRSGLTISWRLKILPGPKGKGKNQKADYIGRPPWELPRSTDCLHSSLIFGGSPRPHWVLLVVRPRQRKKTKIHESHPMLNERFEPGRPLGVFSYFYGCWKVCQRGRSLNAFRRLQSAYHALPLVVRKVMPSSENIYPGVWRKTVKTLASCEKAYGTEDKKMAPCWKERCMLTHNMVRFGPRTLVGAKRARAEGLGTVHIRRTARKKKRNKTPVLTHNLVRFGSRTLVGAKKAADIYDQEESTGVTYQKRGFSACQL